MAKAKRSVCSWSKWKWLGAVLLCFVLVQLITSNSIYQFSFNDITFYARWDRLGAAGDYTDGPEVEGASAEQSDDRRLDEIRVKSEQQIAAVAENFTLLPIPEDGQAPVAAGSAPTQDQSTTENGATSFGSTPSPKFAVEAAVTVPAETTNGTEVRQNENNATAVLFTPQSSVLPQCPEQPPVLVGPIRVWFDYPTFDEIFKLYPYLEPGGHGKPRDCVSRHRVAIIIPYRDRPAHLRAFLHNMHSLLTKQQLDYAIFVVEQIANQTFNRAKLMNVGYAEANKLYDWQCYIFHDVDLLPQDDRNIYSCPEMPRHMSVGVDKFNYKLPYTSIFGGITALSRPHFASMNGYPNDYWGWGGEDDDMSTRVTLAKLKISRYPAPIAKYKMIKHKQETTNPTNSCRFKLMSKTKSRWKADGLSNLQYNVLEVDLQPTYTRILVDLLEKQSKAELVKTSGLSKCY